ncbi:MAG: histidine--tRNA ligase [Mycoplasmataceae bacterium]|nr:histidine--tRNA ligase [Mycoplasmataceae bacterium]
MIQRPKGTKDIYGDDEKIYSLIFNSFEILANTYNFQKISTPIFEYCSLFEKTSGETSDIVSKEIYSFLDLSGRKLALRPEGTAPVGRAIIENKLLNINQFNKLFYIGPMFRYERPQKGRMRQFYQIGVESIGNNSIYSITEVIKLADDFLKQIDIGDYILKINNIGTFEERTNFEKSLSLYFEKNKNELSDLSISRIRVNPMRILDDKVDSTNHIVLNAPKITEFLSNESRNSFEELLSLLTNANISYQLDFNLVRGLDYYSNVVFEFESNSKSLGSKSTITGGGCYNNLIKDASQNIVGVGFGIGVERIFEIIKNEKKLEHNNLDVYFMINNKTEFEKLFPLVSELRNNNITVDFNKKFDKSKKLFAEAISFKPKQLVYYELFDDNFNELITIKDIVKNQKIEVEKINLVQIISQIIKNDNI